MLGWEFPPFISGGLGTACFGLTKGLDRLGHEVMFVLPRPVEAGAATHVRMLSPTNVAPGGTHAATPIAAESPGYWMRHLGFAAPAAMGVDRVEERSVAHGPSVAGIEGAAASTMADFAHAVFVSLPAGFSSPYGDGGPVSRPDSGSLLEMRDRLLRDAAALGVTPDVVHILQREIAALRASGVDAPDWLEWVQSFADTRGSQAFGRAAPRSDHYSGDLFAEAGRYARLVLRLARTERFDVVHAHDWLTFPAGLAAAHATGRPFIAHVHATEFDRSGEHVNQRVYDIERRGMHGATRVVCVSEYTRRICEQRYAVDPRKLRVVYNGIEVDAAQPTEESRIEARDKIVLFLGRITMQKGPEYFIAAAKRVLEKIENVKFVVAGSGDMATRMIELAAQMGIGHKVLFTGFLRGKDVARVFEMADLYVMPSVSEPFGIAPLEAIAHGTPVIISKQSGVSEVLTHALKVDFWDIDDMANKIVAVLRHTPLSSTLSEHGSMEIRRLTWDGAAEKAAKVYEEAMASVGARR